MLERYDRPIVSVVGHSQNERAINTDLALLEECFKIELPGQAELTLAQDKVLGLLLCYKEAIEKEKVAQALTILTRYENALQPYLEIYFTILELQLEDNYGVWVTNFKNSEVYRFYERNVARNEQARRWGISLVMSVVPRT